MDDSFINEPDKNRQGIIETANNWYYKIITIEPILRNEIIKRDLDAILKTSYARIVFLGVDANDNGDIIKTELKNIKAIAYLFKYILLSLTDDECNFKFITVETKRYLNTEYKGVFRFWRDEFNIRMKKIPINCIIGAKQRFSKTPYLEDENNNGLSEERAKKILDRLIEKKFFPSNCKIDNFSWYFCGKDARKGIKKPAALKWIGIQEEFVYFCGKLSNAIIKGGRIKWQNLQLIFSDEIKDNAIINWKNLPQEWGKLINGAIKKKGRTSAGLTRKDDLDYIFE